MTPGKLCTSFQFFVKPRKAALCEDTSSSIFFRASSCGCWEGQLGMNTCVHRNHPLNFSSQVQTEVPFVSLPCVCFLGSHILVKMTKPPSEPTSILIFQNLGKLLCATYWIKFWQHLYLARCSVKVWETVLSLKQWNERNGRKHASVTAGSRKWPWPE